VIRATTSRGEPGGTGATIRIVLAGKVVCASPAGAIDANTVINTAVIEIGTARIAPWRQIVSDSRTQRGTNC
jgi:hypothetical protein